MLVGKINETIFVSKVDKAVCAHFDQQMLRAEELCIVVCVLRGQQGTGQLMKTEA